MRESDGTTHNHYWTYQTTNIMKTRLAVTQLQYSSPDPDYYGSSIRRSQKAPCDPNSYYPPTPNPADIQPWYTHGRGKWAVLHGHRLFGEKTRSAESRKAMKRR